MGGARTPGRGSLSYFNFDGFSHFSLGIIVECRTIVVACRTRNQVSPGSNPPLLPFRRLGIFVLSIDAPVDSAV